MRAEVGLSMFPIKRAGGVVKRTADIIFEVPDKTVI
jgi:hypothetical protein